jgi:HAMP domain-containing protein
MTDEKRKKLCSWLRDQEQPTCVKAADEIERLAKEVEWLMQEIKSVIGLLYQKSECEHD